MALDPERWRRIEDLYDRASSRPTPERADFLSAECADDPSLGAEVLAMLEADDTSRPLGIERLICDEPPTGEREDVRIGTRIGPWRLESVVGRGGSGIVYLVNRADGQYEQRAALKLLAGCVTRTETVARFHAERRILARLVHPNIARLVDGGVTLDGTPYLVMDYVDGTTLTAYCDERRLSVDERLHIFCVVCGAVDHAHRALVVHRDLKPSNIYVSEQGEVKLLDFGIAKLLDPETQADVPPTVTECRALTPAYAAPEQLRHDQVTTATDVYSLGVVLYELLSGRRPFAVDGLSPAEAERLVTETDPPTPSVAAGTASPDVIDARGTTPDRLRSRLRGDVDRICLMALQRQPARRYGSALQLADDIERFLDGRPVQARPTTAAYRVQRFIGRNRLAVGAAFSFVVLLAAFAIVALLQARVVAAERDRARTERDKSQEIVQVLVDLFQASNPEVVPDGDKLPIGVFLENAETRVVGALGSQPDVRATMLRVLGQVHSARSAYPKARTLLERAYADLKQLRGVDDPETLGAEVDLARVLTEAGDNASARTLLEDASARCLRTLGERHALTARVFHTLATTYKEADKAEPLFSRALAIRRAVLRPDDPEIAATLGDLAVQAMRRDHLAEAKSRFDEALALANRVRGGRHVIAHEITSNYAALLSRMGDFAGAEALTRRTLQLAMELIGPESVQVAFALNNLATNLASEGRLEEAVDLGRQAYEHFAAIVGADDSRSANAARNVAIMLLWLDRAGEARPWIERAIQASTASDGPDARPTVYMRAQLSTVKLALGDAPAAVRELRGTLAQMETLVPPEGHYMLADLRLFLGRALLASGDAAGAEAEFRRALAYRQRTLPATAVQIAVATCDLGRALVAGGHVDQARPLLEGCVPRLTSYGLMARSTRDDLVHLLQRLQ